MARYTLILMHSKLPDIPIPGSNHEIEITSRSPQKAKAACQRKGPKNGPC